MSLRPDALKRWPVVGGVLTLMLLAALAVAYWENYQDRQRYLQKPKLPPPLRPRQPDRQPPRQPRAHRPRRAGDRAEVAKVTSASWVETR